jgi:hypothetical protein
LNHGKEVGGEFVVACGDTAKVLQPGGEGLDQVALSMELLAETSPTQYAREKAEP